LTPFASGGVLADLASSPLSVCLDRGTGGRRNAEINKIPLSVWEDVYTNDKSGRVIARIDLNVLKLNVLTENDEKLQG
jgi:hypothetical protein